MAGEHDVRECGQRLGVWLRLVDVEGRSGDASFGESVEERLLVDKPPRQYSRRHHRVRVHRGCGRSTV